MLYLTFDCVTTFLLPYFIGMVYFAIACWVKSEISVAAISTPPTIRPEQVFTLLEEIVPITHAGIIIHQPKSIRSRKSPITPVAELDKYQDIKKPRSKSILPRSTAA
ncbi:MAG: hypothetical protein LH474_07450 [Chamaesiphon sp.]|nr:hypothetical protein [Chamaesiphon sp.]